MQYDENRVTKGNDAMLTVNWVTWELLSVTTRWRCIKDRTCWILTATHLFQVETCEWRALSVCLRAVSIEMMMMMMSKTQTKQSVLATVTIKPRTVMKLHSHYRCCRYDINTTVNTEPDTQCSTQLTQEYFFQKKSPRIYLQYPLKQFADAFSK